MLVRKTSVSLRILSRALMMGAASVAMVSAVGHVPAAYAQSTTSSINGTVLTAAGGPAAGAQVEVLHVPTGTRTTAVANNEGRYQASNLRPGGPYTISVQGGGAAQQAYNNVFLDLDAPFELNVGRPVTAAGAEEIVVTSQRRSGSNVMGSKTTFGQQTIESAPTVTRDLRDIIKRDPKVIIDPSNSGAISIAGTNNRFNSLTVDGIKQNDDFGLNAGGYPTQRQPISLDAIGQLSVLTAPFDVEYSGFQGGTINIVTKSGTNDFHGSAYYFYSNDNLSGKDSGGQKNLISPYTNKTYGATLGGPILKDKLFFFGSYEMYDATSPVLFGPADGGFGNLITGVTVAETARVSEIAKRVYGYNTLGIGQGALPEKDEKWLAKVDWNILENHRAQFTYEHDKGNNVIDSASSTSTNRLSLLSNWYDRTQKMNSYSAQFFSDWTSDFSTELKIGRKNVDSLRPSFGDTTIGEVRIRTPTGGQIYFGPDTSGQANILNTRTDTFKLKAKYLLGDHTLTGGYERDYNKYYNLFLQNALGVYTFNSITDFENRTAANFLYNNANTGNVNDAAARFDYSVHSLYLQDNWKFDDKLTIQYGLRYERYENSDAPLASGLFQQRYGFSNNATLDGRDVWLPRAGATYKLTDQTTIRGGAGLFSTLGPAVWVSNNYSNDGFTQRSLNVSSGNPALLQNVTLAVPAAAKASLAGGDGFANALDPNFDIPTSWRYNLAVDHTFSNGVNVTAEALYTRVNKAAVYKDIRLIQTGTAPDGRPRYGFRTDGRGVGSDLLMTNTDKGRGYVLTLAADKTWDAGAYGEFQTFVTYAYQNIKEVSPLSSSVATSSYDQFAVLDPNTPTLAHSSYETRNRFTSGVTWTKRFFGDAKTTVGLFHESKEGLPYSFGFGCTSAVNPFGDSACTRSRSRELFYVPTGASDPLVNFSSAAIATAVNDYIDRNGLGKYRGKIAPRNAFYSPWNHTVDLHVSQEIPSFFDGHFAELTLDIKNLTNLINKQWGRYEQVPFFNVVEVLTPAIGADGKYVYSTLPRDPALQTQNRSSVWQIQVGVRYKF